MRKCSFLLFTLLVSSMAQSASLEDALAHLKKLDPEQYNGYDLEKLRQVDRISPNRGKQITDSDFVGLTPLCQLDNIKRLDFSYSEQVTGEGLKAFTEVCGQWESITHLNLGGRLIDKHLGALNAFPNLEVLNIDFHGDGSKSPVVGEFFKSINLPNLKAIHAKHTNLSDENAILILNWPSLELFNFADTPLSQEILERLGNEKIDYGKRQWDLKRVQYEAISRTTEPNMDYEETLVYCQLTLERNIITKDAYEWAKERGLCLVAYFNLAGESFTNVELLKLNPPEKVDLSDWGP